MWQSSNTIRAGQMLHIALCCLEGSTPEEREGLFLFIALRWMQDPGGVMVWLAENIQACLRIFRRAQHQWLARDILHLPQGVFAVFVLWPAFKGLIRSIRLIRGRKESLSSGVLPSRQGLGGGLSISEGVAPGYSW